MEDSVNTGRGAAQPAEAAALDRIAALEQAGLLEQRLASTSLDPRRLRLFRARLAEIRRRRSAWRPPEHRVTLPVVLWDLEHGWPVAAWLSLGLDSTPVLSSGWTGITGATRTALARAGGHAAAWLRGRSGVEIDFFPHRHSLSLLGAAGGTLPDDLTLSGPSFTGAFALALIALWTGRPLLPDLWVFGQFSPSGHLAPVGRLTEKLGAITREGLACRTVIAVAPDTRRPPALPDRPGVWLTPGEPIGALIAAAWPGGGERFVPVPALRAAPSPETLLGSLENRMELPALAELAASLDQPGASARARFQVRRTLGAVASRRGDMAAARTSMEAALAIGRRCLEDESIDIEDYTELCNNLGVLFTDLHEWTRARRWLRTGLRRLEGATGYTAREQEGRLWSSLGQMELWRGSPDRAEPWLRRALGRLGKGRNLNYLAGALICRHRVATRAGRRPAAAWLEEAAGLLAQSRLRADFQSDEEYRFHRSFVVYWEARLGHEQGRRPVGLAKEAKALRREAAHPLFPLAGAACWLAATEPGPGEPAEVDATALELLREVASADGIILRLLASGWTARLWVAGVDREALLQVWPRPDRDPSEGGEGDPAKGPPPTVVGQSRQEQEMVRRILEILDLLEPLSGSFSGEAAWCRARLATASPADARRVTSRTGDMKEFLVALAEKIAY